MKNQPHDIWAKYYDYVYQQTYAGMYDSLLLSTLMGVNQILPKGSIIDFGAGTGRISIPLAEKGYSVIAVEKSSGMVQEFQRKLEQLNLSIKLHHCSIAEYENGKADLAIALFTVLSYSTTEQELTKHLKTC